LTIKIRGFSTSRSIEKLKIKKFIAQNMGNFCSCHRRCHRDTNGSGCYNTSLLPIIQAFSSGGVGIGGGGGCYNNNYINANNNLLPQVYSGIPNNVVSYNNVAIASPCCQPCQPNVGINCGFSLKCGICSSRKCFQRKHIQNCTTQCSETLNYHILHLPPQQQQCYGMGIGGYGFGGGYNNLVHPGFRFDNGVSGVFDPSFVDTGDAVIGSGVFFADGRSGGFLADGSCGGFLADGSSGGFLEDGRSGGFLADGRSGGFLADGRSGGFLADGSSGGFLEDGSSDGFLADGRSGSFLADGSTWY
jgi:hypothetical protein